MSTAKGALVRSGPASTIFHYITRSECYSQWAITVVFHVVPVLVEYSTFWTFAKAATILAILTHLQSLFFIVIYFILKYLRVDKQRTLVFPIFYCNAIKWFIGFRVYWFFYQ